MHAISISIVVISTLFFQHTYGQSRDYIKYRDDLNIRACGAIDSSIVYGSIRKLEAFDTTFITKHLEQYYLDLAMNYWLASGDGDTVFLQKCISACRKALYRAPAFSPAHWNLALAYSRLDECELAVKHMDLCLHYTKEKSIDPYTREEARKLRERCGQ